MVKFFETVKILFGKTLIMYENVFFVSILYNKYKKMKIIFIQIKIKTMIFFSKTVVK